MKKVIFVGDSTLIGIDDTGRNGYGVYVKEYFSGRAKVILPADNCQDTRFTARFIEELYTSEDLSSADVVYWNNGLWDVLHLGKNPEPMVSKALYAENLKKIYGRIRELAPNARIVFATSVPIIESRCKGVVRKNSEIEEYNRIAEEVLTAMGVEIQDLYGIVKEFSEEYRSEDSVHLSPDGAERLSRAVIARVEELLR